VKARSCVIICVCILMPCALLISCANVIKYTICELEMNGVLGHSNNKGLETLHPFKNQEYIMSLVTGHGLSMVIMYDGVLWGWGVNSYGELGDGTIENRYYPVRIMDNVKIASSAFGRTKVVTNDGELWAWGNNSRGLYGNGTTEDSTVPVKIMSDVIFVSVGELHTAIIKQDNSLWAWGALEQEIFLDSYFPREPTRIMDDVVYVSAGFSAYTMVVTVDGVLWTWGKNFSGELGIGRGIILEHVALPPVMVMENVVHVFAGGELTGAIKEDGTLWTWGNNNVGGVGDGTRVCRYYPVKIMDDVKYATNSIAISNDGTMWAWGFRDFGGTHTMDIYPVKIMENVAMVSSLGHTMVITYDGLLWGWGDNSYGQLGVVSISYSHIPIRIVEQKRLY